MVGWGGANDGMSSSSSNTGIQLVFGLLVRGSLQIIISLIIESSYEYLLALPSGDLVQRKPEELNVMPFTFISKGIHTVRAGVWISGSLAWMECCAIQTKKVKIHSDR